MRLMGTSLLGSSGDTSQEGGLPYRGLDIIWAVLAWPLNGGMRAVVCCVSLQTGHSPVVGGPYLGAPRLGR